ncbi:MAG: glycoside hydrolase family 32 protein [Clostridia bacterium]|nr:glycoside hydrolase family 32 protein [Clostridia bacterium]
MLEKDADNAMIDYTEKPKFHYRPAKGWINDPNGLVYFKGWYHVFYQHAPDFETPWKQPMHWGHARTKNFTDWEELPVALTPGAPYDGGGCWSGTAIVKDGRLYLFYAAITAVSSVAVAVSDDGIHFEKYKGNPVIAGYPADGGPDFRDPAVCSINGDFYCVVASGNPESRTGRLLLYKSRGLFDWTYSGVMCEWANCKYAECPSFMTAEDGMYLLASSVCPFDSRRFFTVKYGRFSEGRFTALYSGEPDKGPDQYAGQVFRDGAGRNLLITWIPGWEYSGYAQKDVGCMSVPRELKCTDGKITAFPVKEVRHLLKTEDPALRRTPNGFTVERQGREPCVYEGEIYDLQLIRDGYIMEVFVNGGESVYSILL